MVRVSFLMPVKDAEATVRIASESTLRSMNREDELLVFLDGSSDRSLEIVNSIGDPRIRVVNSHKNIGVAAALNQLLEIASGEYVARIDADDMSLPWRVSHSLRYLNKGRLDFAFTAAILFGPKIRIPIPHSVSSLGPDEAESILASRNPFVHSTMIAKTESIRSLGGYPTGLAEDYMLWMLAASKGFRLGQSAVPTVLHRLHGAQVTRSENWTQDASMQLEDLRSELKATSRPMADRTGALKSIAKRLLFR